MSTRLLKGNTPHLTVKVTQKHIDEGVARNSNHCMVAEAIRDAKPSLSRVCGDIQTFRASDAERGERYIWLTPPSVQRLIVDYDRGKKPKPFVFTLNSGQTIDQERQSEEHKAKKREYARAYAAKRAKRNKGKKAAKLKKSPRTNAVPNIHGGKEPPRSIGARRAFGLRSLVV